MNKVWEKILGFINKHRVISVLILLFVLFKVYSLGVYAYNAYTYGRFVKVGDLDIKDKYGQNLIGTPNGTAIDNQNILLLVPISGKYYLYNVNLKNNKFYNKKLTLDADFILPIGNYKNEIFFLTGNNFKNSDSNVSHIKNYPDTCKTMVYNYVNNSLADGPIFSHKFNYDIKSYSTIKGDTVIFIPQPEKMGNKLIYNGIIFNPVAKTFEKTFKYLNNDYAKIMSNDLENLNSNNIIYATYKNDTKFISYSEKHNTMYDIDVSDFKKAKIVPRNKTNIYIKLTNNRVLLMSHPDTSGKYTYFNLFETKNKKLHYVKTITYINKGGLWDYNKISSDNVAVLNSDQILFIGGKCGIADVTWTNKSCYLLDIKKDKIIKLNDFPFKISGQYLICKNGKVAIVGGYKDGFWNRKKMKSVYIFISGKKCKNI